MITLTFKDFSNPENFPDNVGIELYVLRNKQEFLYVGISKSNVWNRWFGSRGRMWKVFDRNGNHIGWNSTGYVGITIIKEMPESLLWEIDLWSLKECVEFLGIPFIEDFPLIKSSQFGHIYDIKEIEPKFISKLSTKLNSIYNSNSFPDNDFKEKYFSLLDCA